MLYHHARKTIQGSHDPMIPSSSAAAHPEAAGSDKSDDPNRDSDTTASDGDSSAKKKKGVAARPAKAGATNGARNPVFDALATACGVLPDQVTKALGGEIGTALRDIKQVSADVTPAEIGRRAKAYRDQWPNATLSPSALAKWWAKFAPGAAQKKEAGAPPVGVKPPPDGYDRACAALWGKDWECKLPSWASMLHTDKRQIFEWLKQNPK